VRFRRGNDELAEMGRAVETFKENALAEDERKEPRISSVRPDKAKAISAMSHELRTPMHAILATQNGRIHGHHRTELLP
jgi:signal transduction histidine kinase